MSTIDGSAKDEPDDGAAPRPADQAPNTGRSAPEPAEGSDDAPRPGEGSPRG